MVGGLRHRCNPDMGHLWGPRSRNNWKKKPARFQRKGRKSSPSRGDLKNRVQKVTWTSRLRAGGLYSSSTRGDPKLQSGRGCCLKRTNSLLSGRNIFKLRNLMEWGANYRAAKGKAGIGHQNGIDPVSPNRGVSPNVENLKQMQNVERKDRRPNMGERSASGEAMELLSIREALPAARETPSGCRCCPYSYLPMRPDHEGASGTLKRNGPRQ